MKLTQELKEFVQETESALKGYGRRNFMARTVKALGVGGQALAERELGWNRVTIRKGLSELEGGFCYVDQYHARGRKKMEEKQPELLEDIRQIAHLYSQTDATFQTTRLYTRLSAAEVRRQLQEQKGYSEEELPCEDTIRRKLNQLGYGLKAVRKNQPLKKVPQTNAIFEQVHKQNEQADADESCLRLSLDAKAAILIGCFSRGGVSRVVVNANDHDFQNKGAKVTPFGIYLPQYDELYLYFTTSKVTSDFIADCLCDFWVSQRHRFPQVTSLLLNLDNGPENHSRRTQFMQRIVNFVDDFQILVKLAYYPPYHSKHNPHPEGTRRVWGHLEQHWNGSLLDTLDTVLNFARSFTRKGRNPSVQLVKRLYLTGVKLSQKQMRRLERRLNRLPGLEPWSLFVSPVFCTRAG